MKLPDNKRKLKDFSQDVFLTGFREGLKASLSIIKIMVPASLLVSLLDYFGLIKIISGIISPFCGFLGLHGEAILALLSGYLLNTLSAIAVMSTLPLTIKEITILSSMILLSHALPLELAVQRKAGGPLFLIIFIRLSSSLLTGFILNLIIPAGTAPLDTALLASTPDKTVSFRDTMVSWLSGNTIIVKVIIINIMITIFYRFLKRSDIVEKISSLFKYFMFIFGLPKETTFFWIITNVVSLVIGTSMIIEAKENKSLDEIHLKKLNISLASCHSLIQESANFLPVGAPLLFLIAPRVVISLVSVWLYNLYLYLRRYRVSIAPSALNG